jgi:hypothetical protein
MTTIIEKYQENKSKSIAIRPYFDQTMDNMGLEKYNLTLFDNVYHEEQLACLEYNGIKRYVTGLNEFAPDVKNLPEEERTAQIKHIRQVVAQLESELAANILDPEDTQFWNKVRLLKPDNDEFWGKITLRCGNEPLFLDPKKDPYDLIKLYAIEAGGFSIVAKNLEAATRSPKAPKFYLDKVESTVSHRTEVSKLRNRALSELQKLYDKSANKLFLVAKVVDADSSQYTKSTPLDVIYENMDKFINGLSVERDKKRSAQQFIDVANDTMENLKLRAIVKDATRYKLIAGKSDGFIYHMATSANMGRTPADVIEYLKNPVNEEILMKLMPAVESYWNN